MRARAVVVPADDRRAQPICARLILSGLLRTETSVPETDRYG